MYCTRRIWRIPVEYLADLIWVADGDGDGVRALQRVNLHDRLEVDRHELFHELHLRLHRLHAQVLDVAGEPLVEPQVSPPGRGH